MGSLRGVEITEGKIGANSSISREFALIGNGVAVTGKVQLNTVYTLLRLSDAEDIGIDKAYDTDNDVRVYRHISEFYRMAGEGVTLYIMLVAKTVMPADMVPYAKTLVVEAGGSVSDIAFAFNPPATDYTLTILNGLDENIYDAISALQTFAVWALNNDMPLHTLLEGRAISDTLSSLANLRALKVGDVELDCEKVTLVCGQDYAYADGLSENGKKFADVGNYLGVIAANDWNKNPGEVESGNLTDTALDSFIVGGLSNHKKYSEVYDSLSTLDDKGYVFPIRYTGLSGYFWNDGHVCARITVDKTGNMNQHTIYYSHTFDQSVRALRAAYLPEVKKVYELDDNGKLPAGTVDILNQYGDVAFADMGSLISAGSTSVDPDSDLLVEKQLNVSFSVVPNGCINVIKGTLNLKNS